ncbi:unnamed protein product [Lampetra planeri]
MATSWSSGSGRVRDEVMVDEVMDEVDEEEDEEEDEEDPEEAERLREAASGVGDAFRAAAAVTTATRGPRDDTAAPPGRAPSKRNAVEAGERREWNELKTTPEFRAHVARKLSALLDGSVDGRGG